MDKLLPTQKTDKKKWKENYYKKKVNKNYTNLVTVY